MIGQKRVIGPFGGVVTEGLLELSVLPGLFHSTISQNLSRTSRIISTYSTSDGYDVAFTDATSVLLVVLRRRRRTRVIDFDHIDEFGILRHLYHLILRKLLSLFIRFLCRFLCRGYIIEMTLDKYEKYDQLLFSRTQSQQDSQHSRESQHSQQSKKVSESRDQDSIDLSLLTSRKVVNSTKSKESRE